MPHGFPSASFAVGARLLARAHREKIFARHRYTKLRTKAVVISDKIAHQLRTPLAIEARRQRLGRSIGLDEQFPHRLPARLAQHRGTGLELEIERSAQ